MGAVPETCFLHDDLHMRPACFMPDLPGPPPRSPLYRPSEGCATYSRTRQGCQGWSGDRVTFAAPMSPRPYATIQCARPSPGFRRSLHPSRFVRGSGGASATGERDEHLAEVAGLGDTLREGEPGCAIAEREVGAIGIDAGHLPRTVGLAKEPGRVQATGLGMVRIHVRNRLRLGVDQRIGPGQIGANDVRREVGGAREAAIEMRRCDGHAPEREVGEAGIELRLRMAAEKPPAHTRLVDGL